MKIEFDYSKLRGRIKEKFGTQAAFAGEIGMSSASLSAKLNNAVEFTQNEINKACSLLNVSSDEVTGYFFTQKVQ